MITLEIQLLYKAMNIMYNGYFTTFKWNAQINKYQNFCDN